LWTPDIPKLKAAVQAWWTSLILNALDVANPILNAGVAALQPLVQNFVSTMSANGNALTDTIKPAVSALAAGAFNTSAANLTGAGVSTPDNAAAQAASAFAEAFGFGISSAAVTAAFEALFPEKLNSLNGVGPMLAQMAGFEEVAKAVLEPLYANAFGKSLDYKYRSLFKPDFPDEADAVSWHARRLDKEWKLEDVFAVSGLKPQFENAYIQGAYRPVQPRVLMNAYTDAPFPHDEIKDLLEFNGYRDADVTLMLDAFEKNSTKNVRQQFLTAAVRSTELGTQTPQQLDSDMTLLGFSDDAKSWVQLTVATRKLEQLAELFRKSISEAYKYGQITDADYVPALEGIGISAADAEGHYAIDSIAKRGRDSAAFLRAEEKLAAARTRAATSAAVAAYRTGALDEAALSAALIAAGVDPAIAAFIVTVQTERRQGPQVFVYGRLIGHQGAVVLKEKVAAVEAQYKKQLITDAQAAAALVDLEIPDPNAKALLAPWAALKVKPTTTGELLPR
jgi:hypothetical protein